MSSDRQTGRVSKGGSAQAAEEVPTAREPLQGQRAVDLRAARDFDRLGPLDRLEAEAIRRECPVCVFRATNVPAEALADLECWNCGKPLGGHPVEVRADVPPNMVYAEAPRG